MDGFKLCKKWFWIGIAAGFINPIIGSVYGIALVVEKDHRKEGIIIIAWTIAWAVIAYYLSTWLVERGYLPTFQMKSPGKFIR